MQKGTLWETALANLGFLGVVFATAAVLVLVAWVGQRAMKGRRAISPAKRAAVIGMLSALAVILQIFEFPLLFLAPGFYKLDFSEVPVMIAGFGLGPVAGVLTELLKNVLKVLFRGTTTAFVGDYANFCVGCSLVIPATIIYGIIKTKKGAIIGCIAGTVVITLFGSIFNAVYLLPAFAKFYDWPLEDILEMGHKIFPQFETFSVTTFVTVCVAPLNFIKGAAVSIIVMLIYKPISRVINQI